MDYEKKYKEMKARVLEMGRGYVKGLDYSKPRQIAEYIDPELKESGDERIKEAIITTIHLYYGEPLEDEAKEMIAWLEKQKPIQNINKEDEEVRQYIVRIMEQKDINVPMVQKALAWLEKQGEQKHTDKVERKFKVGDFVVNDYCLGKVIELTDDAYLLDTGQGIPFSCEHNAHLWAIQDAKPGDVLSGKINGDNYILIFKQVTDGWVETYGHYYDVVDRFCAPSQLFCRDYQGTFAPATKEQRDLLFEKMKEAGYEWDTDKKGSK